MLFNYCIIDFNMHMHDIFVCYYFGTFEVLVSIKPRKFADTHSKSSKTVLKFQSFATLEIESELLITVGL